MRNRFDEQLFELNREIIEMGAMCEEAIASAVKALTTGDMELAGRVKTNSGAIDQMERDLKCLSFPEAPSVAFMKTNDTGLISFASDFEFVVRFPDVVSTLKESHLTVGW